MDYKDEIAARLREHRNTVLQLSRQKLADKSGVLTVSALGNYENGLREPDLATVNELAKVYGLSPEYILGFSQDKTTQDTADRQAAWIKYILNLIEDFEHETQITLTDDQRIEWLRIAYPRVHDLPNPYLTAPPDKNAIAKAVRAYYGKVANLKRSELSLVAEESATYVKPPHD